MLRTRATRHRGRGGCRVGWSGSSGTVECTQVAVVHSAVAGSERKVGVRGEERSWRPVAWSSPSPALPPRLVLQAVLLQSCHRLHRARPARRAAARAVVARLARSFSSSLPPPSLGHNHACGSSTGLLASCYTRTASGATARRSLLLAGTFSASPGCSEDELRGRPGRRAPWPDDSRAPSHYALSRLRVLPGRTSSALPVRALARRAVEERSRGSAAPGSALALQLTLSTHRSVSKVYKASPDLFFAVVVVEATLEHRDRRIPPPLSPRLPRPPLDTPFVAILDTHEHVARIVRGVEGERGRAGEKRRRTGRRRGGSAGPFGEGTERLHLASQCREQAMRPSHGAARSLPAEQGEETPRLAHHLLAVGPSPPRRAVSFSCGPELSLPQALLPPFEGLEAVLSGRGTVASRFASARSSLLHRSTLSSAQARQLLYLAIVPASLSPALPVPLGLSLELQRVDEEAELARGRHWSPYRQFCVP